MGGVRLEDGRTAAYPSLDGQGIAVDPHQERPDITWVALADRFDIVVAIRLQEQAALAEATHVIDGCDLVHAVDVDRLTQRVYGDA